MSLSADSEVNIVDALLREQRSLTAVERFSREHDSTTIDRPGRHLQQRYYRQLMPATAPGPGQQFAFEVDLDACSGCKACVVACHTLNGLEEHETWRRVGTLAGENTIQHVTAACHHCEEPGCLNGCPVKAYVKDEATGVVRHLDDQCIGCKYCTMMCPYEVPQYSEQLGIVRKCDMCHQRLDVGEAPACVQACPNEAIRIRIVDRGLPEQGGTGDTAAIGRTAAVSAVSRLVAGAPDSTITRPTTVYRTKRQAVLDACVPQDAASDGVAENHWPLAVMLVATQAAIGAVLVERSVAAISFLLHGDLPPGVARINTTVAVGVAGLGLSVAPLHLGQPLKAWRIFLGLRTSWLSREAIILGGFMGLLTAAAALLWLPVVGGYFPAARPPCFPHWMPNLLIWASVPMGLAGFYCSAMIYIATRRRLWRFQRTMVRFGGSALCLGLLGFSLAASIAAELMLLATAASVLCLAAIATKLAFEVSTHYACVDGGGDEAMRSARLVWGPLRRLLLGRLTAAAMAGLCIAAAVLTGVTAGLDEPAGTVPVTVPVCLAAAFVLLMIGETVERLLYFASVVYDRMPGTLR